MLENIVGKEENAGYQHFLLFIQCFQQSSSTGSLKVGLCFKNYMSKHLDKMSHVLLNGEDLLDAFYNTSHQIQFLYPQAVIMKH